MDNELMHYGVPGMRWGHRKQYTSQKRLDRRKNKELKKLTRRDVRKTASEDKWIDRFDKDIKKNVAKYGANDAHTKKSAALYAKNYAVGMTNRKLRAHEMKAYSKMSLDDIKKENVEVGKQMCKDFAGNLALSAIQIATLQPPVVAGYRRRYSDYRQDLRTKDFDYSKVGGRYLDEGRKIAEDKIKKAAKNRSA